MSTTSKLSCIDLFAGAGGLSEGFRRQGFKVLAANDFDSWAEQTYKESHRGTAFLSGPIEQLSTKDFLKATGTSGR